ncbi:MAG: Thiamine-monophosphate kinase (EC [uncultured Sulfurovum sp.]|uniref:Thiamine-monophosphate kinase n=1 Tax=uncultured Sulfurovum sp. TaxID=269237 RepID=A0A6S6U992_9BACT|nr:MAG: Thiamine-monophosphate kinase (EC [uncultured Sulfurovum sp.]
MNKEDYLINKLNSKHIGDDAAVVDGKIYSMDAFFEDVHFKREWMSMWQIGRKAMLINLSDAVAMDADPKYALVTLSLPKDITTDEIDELLASLEKTAKDFQCEIIGGDTIAGDKLHISITIVSESKRPLYRNNVQVGDLLAYTGTLGESKEGLEALLRGESIKPKSRFFEPKLKREFIKQARKYLNAGMDISDGLFCDTNKLLAIKKQTMYMFEEISDEVGSSGEEYEMLVTFGPEHYSKLKEIAERTHTPLTVFAKVEKANDGVLFECQNHHF